jgi:hypothetical protein
VITGCARVASVSSIASCSWKPSNHGYGNLSAAVIGGSSTAQLLVTISTRSTRR